MKNYGDVTKIKGSDVPAVDVITFGAPCQDLSIAGKRAGMKSVLMGDEENTRSGLFFEAIRIIKEMREHDRANGRADEFLRPRYGVYENVPGALSSNKGEDFRCVLEETARIVQKDADIPGPPKEGWPSAGCIVGEGYSLAWAVHDAQHHGVPQRRKRIALLADFGGYTAGEILFAPEYVREAEGAESNDPFGHTGRGSGCEVRTLEEGLHRDSSESEQARKTVAGDPTGSA